MAHILIIEDDSDIAALERDYLEIAGHEVDIEDNGHSGLTHALSGTYDLILLDLMLPGISGQEVCRSLRAASDIPILMVTARITDDDKVEGLELGADDYIEKPFSPRVLVARVQAHLDRYERLKGSGTTETVIAGPISMEVATRTVTIAGTPVSLRNKEFELLLLFARNPGVVFSRDVLYERIWGTDAPSDTTTVTVHIRRLRNKIDPLTPKGPLIQTLRGAGYRLAV